MYTKEEVFNNGLGGSRLTQSFHLFKKLIYNKLSREIKLLQFTN